MSMKTISPESQVRMMLLANRYFTPFALMLVGTGLALSRPLPWVQGACVGLLLLTFALNTGTARIVRRRGEVSRRLAALRLFSNLAVNVVLVYLLAGAWRPIWLLFVLTPVATAMFASRRRTVTMAVGVSSLMLATYVVRDFVAPVDWGSVGVQALFIVFLSLLVNELSSLLHGSD